MWQSTLPKPGLKVRRSWMKPDDSRIDGPELRSLSLQEQGFRAVLQPFQGRAAKPDALYFNDDNQTQGALVALHCLGIRTGHDVAVATLANTGSKALWGHEDDLISLQEDRMELVEPQLREPLERA